VIDTYTDVQRATDSRHYLHGALNKFDILIVSQYRKVTNKQTNNFLNNNNNNNNNNNMINIKYNSNNDDTKQRKFKHSQS